jgi:hypothetical protein
MTKTFLAALFALALSPLLSAVEPAAERFDDIRARAHQMGETDEGMAYEKQFSKTFAKPMQTALQDCTKDTKPPYTVNIVFVIGREGTTLRIVSAPDQPVSACVAQKLTGLKLPAPPKADWMVAVNITIE